MNAPRHVSATPLPTIPRTAEAGIALVSVVVVLIVVLAFSFSLLSYVRTNTTHALESEMHIEADYLAYAALNTAFAEVMTLEDPDDDGLGAMGVATPIPLTDSVGAVIGEFRTYVRKDGTNNILVGLAAIPSFADPRMLRSTEGLIVAESTFALAPRPGAISISGPISNPTFPNMGDNTLLIDGGDHPAIALPSAVAYEAVMAELCDQMQAGHIDGSEFVGGETSTYYSPWLGNVTLPVITEESGFMEAAELNTYRNELRTAVLDLASNADRTITTRVTGNHTWGTESAPEVTVIEATTIGKDRVFDTKGQTITGHGTLIIKHTVRPQKNLNLNWTGNVYVLGFEEDAASSDDLLYMKGTQGTINGNLILLASDHTEASFEMAESSSSYVGSADKRQTMLTINGSLLTLAEASSHEAEVELENSTVLTVNGLLGMFGSRIELEASGSRSRLTVNGTIAIGMAQDLEDIARTDDFEFEMDGAVTITYDEELVNAALANLGELETTLSGSSPSGAPVYDTFRLAGTISTAGSGTNSLAHLNQLVSEGTDLGVDIDSLNVALLRAIQEAALSESEGETSGGQ